MSLFEREIQHIERRLRDLEKAFTGMPVRFSASAGPQYPAGIIKVTNKIQQGAAGTNGGFYQVYPALGTADSAGADALLTSHTANLTMPEGMYDTSTDPQKENYLAIGLNLAENAQSGHTVTLNDWYVGIKVGMYIKDHGDGDKLPNGNQLFSGQMAEVWAFRSGGGFTPSWGFLKSLWTPGTNTCTLTPCAGPTDATPTGDADVTPYIQLPTNRPAVCLSAVVNDILAYGTFSGITMLFNAPQMPRPTDQYQVIQNQGGTGTPNWTADYTKVHS